VVERRERAALGCSEHHDTGRVKTLYLVTVKMRAEETQILLAPACVVEQFIEHMSDASGQHGAPFLRIHFLLQRLLLFRGDAQRSHLGHELPENLGFLPQILICAVEKSIGAVTRDHAAHNGFLIPYFLNGTGARTRHGQGRLIDEARLLEIADLIEPLTDGFLIKSGPDLLNSLLAGERESISRAHQSQQNEKKTYLEGCLHISHPLPAWLP